MGSKFSIPFTEKLPKEYKDESYSKLINKIKKYSYKISKTDLLKFKELIDNYEYIHEEFLLLINEVDYPNLNNKRQVDFNDKNRYSDILPFKDNLVPLKEVNYINASFINIPDKKNFIATQGPLDHTVSDFWEMIYEYNVNIIVMLCNIKEDKKIKCSEYWNKKIMEKDNRFKLENISQLETNYKDLIIRKIQYKKNGDDSIKEVYHLNYIGWQDYAIPNIKDAYDILVQMFDFINKEKSNTTVIHCSAGVGRTGSFLTMINLYNNLLLQKNQRNKYFGLSIFGLVRQLKEMRVFLVKNETEFNFIHKFIYELLEREIFKE